MTITLLKRIYAALLLIILMAAYMGQKVHIYTEDPLHFVAFCADPAGDNGADCGVQERCVVDDYYFFPFLEFLLPAHSFYFEMLARLLPEATHCKLSQSVRMMPLRAPPVA